MTTTIDQVSVFVENRPGKLSELVTLLGDAGIDLRAMSIADTADFGILRVIVDDPAKCTAILRDAACIVSVTKVLAVCIPDQPGSLAKILSLLAGAGQSIEYLYAFITRRSTDAYVILRPEDIDLAARALTDGGVKLASSEELYTL